MNFNEAIEKIMPMVNSGDKHTPFIISSRHNSEYEVDFLSLPPVKVSEYLAKVREYDPCAVSFYGSDFSRGSFSYVFDRVLSARI